MNAQTPPPPGGGPPPPGFAGGVAGPPPPAGGFGYGASGALGPVLLPHAPSATYAKWTFATGLFSILGIFLCFIGPPFGIAAIVMGIVAMKRCDRHPDLYAGKSFAIAGLCCGVVSVLLSVVAVAAFLLV